MDARSTQAEIIPDAREKRTQPRKPVLWKGRLEWDGTMRSCQVWDVSLGGAKIRLGHPPPDGTFVRLTIQDRRPLHGRICWTNGEKAGLKFRHPADLVMAVLGDILQPATQEGH